MQFLGSYLRELRLARGLTLAEVARTTRVSQRHLEALEADAFQALPAPVFTRGFIRAYCQAVGEAADEALARYGALGAQASPVSPARPSARRGEVWRSGSVLASLVLLIVLGLGLLLLNLALRGGAGSASVPPPPAGAAPAVTVPEAPAPTVEAPEKADRARLVARTTEPTWVEVRTDDGRVVQELLPAGATREWESGRRFVLTVGNAGGISLELNGRPMPPLGGSGVVIRRLVIPTDPVSGRP
jgi:cytoskeletal protein RodZ